MEMGEKCVLLCGAGVGGGEQGNKGCGKEEWQRDDGELKKKIIYLV